MRAKLTLHLIHIVQFERGTNKSAPLVEVSKTDGRADRAAGESISVVVGHFPLPAALQ